MEHEQRFRLAQEVCAPLMTRYRYDLIGGGACGSTAWDSDAPRSDLEMLFVSMLPVPCGDPAQRRPRLEKGGEVPL